MLSKFLNLLKQISGKNNLDHSTAFGVGGYVLILEFASTGDIDKIFGEDGSETIKGIIKDAQKSDYVNGNCVLAPLTLAYAEEALELFKN